MQINIEYTYHKELVSSVNSASVMQKLPLHIPRQQVHPSVVRQAVCKCMSHCAFMGVSGVKTDGKAVNLLESQDSFTVTHSFPARTSIVKYYPQ